MINETIIDTLTINVTTVGYKETLIETMIGAGVFFLFAFSLIIIMGVLLYIIYKVITHFWG